MDLVRFASKNRETTDISSNQHERGQTHNAYPRIHPWYFKHTGEKDMLKHTEIYFLAYIFSVDIYNPEKDLKCVRREGGGGGGGGGGRLGLPGKKWKCSGSGSELKVHCEKKYGIKTNEILICSKFSYTNFVNSITSFNHQIKRLYFVAHVIFNSQQKLNGIF